MKKIDNRLFKFEKKLNNSQRILSEDLKNIKGGGNIFSEIGAWVHEKYVDAINWWNEPSNQ